MANCSVRLQVGPDFFSWIPRRGPAEKEAPAPLADLVEAGSHGIEHSLFDALLLDVRAAPLAEVQEAIPDWLLEKESLACLLMARAYRRSHGPRQAEALLMRGLEIGSQEAAILRELAVLLHRSGRLKESAAASELALASRHRVAFDGQLDSEGAFVVARPSDHVDIVRYRGRYYLVPRLPGMLGARAIAGELLLVEANAAYRAVRRAARLPGLAALLRPLNRQTRIGSSGHQSRLLQFGLFVQARAATARFGRIARNLSRGLALRLFAKPIERQATTLLGAYQLAQEAEWPRLST